MSPEATPIAIRAALTATLRSEFDQELGSVLDDTKNAELMHKWRHIAAGEAKEPGSYHRMLAKAEKIQRAGHNPSGKPIEDLISLITSRIGR